MYSLEQTQISFMLMQWRKMSLRHCFSTISHSWLGKIICGGCTLSSTNKLTPFLGWNLLQQSVSKLVQGGIQERFSEMSSSSLLLPSLTHGIINNGMKPGQLSHRQQHPQDYYFFCLFLPGLLEAVPVPPAAVCHLCR